MKTNRRGSSPTCHAFQYARFSATSGRSCSAARSVFFERDSHGVERHPDRRQRALDTQAFAQFYQRGIGLLLHQDRQLGPVDLRLASAADPRSDLAGFTPPLLE